MAEDETSMVAGDCGSNPTGRGTHGGGNATMRAAPPGGVSGSVNNQQLLVLDHAVFATLGDDLARDIAIVQVEYARDVSAAAAAAYDRILSVLTRRT